MDVFDCVICGQKLSDNHKCPIKTENIINASMKRDDDANTLRERPYRDRLSDGFLMLSLSGDM